MTRYIIFTAAFLVLGLTKTAPAMAKDQSQFYMTLSDQVEVEKPVKSNMESPMKHSPSQHGTRPNMPVEKSHKSTLDETPHIHRFHKERVRKLKKHHSKYWMLSKLLIILCHIGLLIMAYLHATH